MSTIVVVGSLNADMIVQVQHIPRPGETILGNKFRIAPGGKGANQAVAAARLGQSVGMVGRVGQDAFGALLTESLAQSQVNHRFVFSDASAATGIAMINVSGEGQNAIVVAPGANYRLSREDIDASRDVFQDAKLLLLQLEIPMEAVIYAAQVAKAYQVQVILNPAPAQPLPAELLSLVDFLMPNETELALLTQKPVTAENEIQEAAEALLALNIKTVIVTMGERGAFALQKEWREHFPAFPIQPLDTTAAGDAFVGAFAVAVSEGKTISEAIRWGNAAGALAATKPGAQPSLPTRTELLEFLDSAGG